MIITIDTDKLKLAASEAGDIFLSPEGEKTLKSILDAEKELLLIREEARQILAEQAGQLKVPFKKIECESIIVTSRSYGSRFQVEDITQLDASLYKTEIKGIVPNIKAKTLINILQSEGSEVEAKYTVDTKAIDKYEKENKKMPEGITEKLRTPVISFKLKENEVDQ